jgi:hypothetical protein
MDPRFVPEEEVIFIPEPDVQVPGGAQFLRADEIVHDRLPGLRSALSSFRTGTLHRPLMMKITEGMTWMMMAPSDDSNHNCYLGGRKR